STSSTATFGYASNEAGSSFECSLDGAPFSACDPAGISYTGLANGPHTFRVRAIDAVHNVDQSPAAYTFSVAVSAQVTPPPIPKPLVPIAPDTRLLGKPAKRTHDRTPTFRFSSNVPGASFQCTVDGGSFKPCHSPSTTAALKPGRHTFGVRAMVSG